MRATRRQAFRAGSVAAVAISTGVLFPESVLASPTDGPIFNVTDPAYGAIGDGGTSDSAAIQSAINAAQAAGGGTVVIPQGRYKLTTGLVVNKAIQIQGVGWNEPPMSGGLATSTRFGTWLIVSGTGFNAFTVNGAAQGAMLGGFAIEIAGQAITSLSAGPIDTPDVIKVDIAGVQISRVLLFNPKRGIRLTAGARTRLSHIYGQPLMYGITIDQSGDVLFIDDVHFNPIWDNRNNTTAPATEWTRKWMTANGVAILITNSDNPQLSNEVYS